MPSRVFHTVLLTDGIDDAVRFLTEVVGMGEPQWADCSAAQSVLVFGWPDHDDPGRRVILGQGPGMLELVEIPPSLRATIVPGVAFTAFATPDVEGFAERSAAAGFDARPVQAVGTTGGTSTMAAVHVGGLPFEFMRFGG